MPEFTKTQDTLLRVAKLVLASCEREQWLPSLARETAELLFAQSRNVVTREDEHMRSVSGALAYYGYAPAGMRTHIARAALDEIREALGEN